MRKLLFLALLPLTVWADAHIFVYHRFGDTRYPSTNTSLEVLRAEFEHFKNNGYKVVPLKTLSDALKHGKPVDEKWVVLTIDDSYKSFYENGLKLFKEYNYPLTLFIFIEATDKGYSDFMSWDQIKEVQQYGEIGLHSYAHGHMVSMSKEAIISDTEKGLASFEKHLGYRPKYYAYPYGEYDRKVRNAIESFGFDLVINQNSGAVDEHSDRFDLDRTALTGENTVKAKLRIKTFPTTWIEPHGWPEDGKLKTIHATIPDNVNDLEYYVSGYGWQRIKAKGNEVKEAVDLPLKLRRTRVFLKQGHRQSSTIIVKE